MKKSAGDHLAEISHTLNAMKKRGEVSDYGYNYTFLDGNIHIKIFLITHFINDEISLVIHPNQVQSMSGFVIGKVTQLLYGKK